MATYYQETYRTNQTNSMSYTEIQADFSRKFSLGALVGIVTAFFTLRRFAHWLRPIQISPSIHLVFDGSGPEQVLATVTNVSGEDQVLVRCSARSAYPIRTALLRHLRKPFTPPRLYPNIWYGAICFDLMGKKPIRLAPKEQRQLSHSLSNHPLCLFLTPQIQVEAQLSEGRIFRRRRIDVPERWRLRPSHRANRKVQKMHKEHIQPTLLHRAADIDAL